MKRFWKVLLIAFLVGFIGSVICNVYFHTVKESRVSKEVSK